VLPNLKLKKCIQKQGFVLFELSITPVKHLPHQLPPGYTLPNNLAAKAAFSPLHKS